MSPASFLAFCGLCLLLAVTPGPDTFLVLRYSLRSVSRGVAAGAGSALGSIVWAALVGVGLAALIEQSAEAYRILKILGGLYLVFLGIQALRHSRVKVQVTDAANEPVRGIRFSVLGAFGAGLLSTLTNPKVGLFFLAIVPQFLPAHGDKFWTTMLLGATDAVFAILYLSAITFIAAKANAWLKRPRVTAILERVSGSILAILGIGTIAISLTE